MEDKGIWQGRTETNQLGGVNDYSYRAANVQEMVWRFMSKSAVHRLQLRARDVNGV